MIQSVANASKNAATELSSHHCLRGSTMLSSIAGMGGNRSAVSNAQLDAIPEQLQQNNNGAIPHNFVRTASGHDPSSANHRGRMPRSSPRNPQTEQFLEMLGLPFNLDQRQPRPTAVASQGVTAVCCCKALLGKLWAFRLFVQTLLLRWVQIHVS